jgi:tRNA A-37 threonylcarbamoyl transferase component Bud32
MKAGSVTRFYLGLGAPAVRRRYPDCRVRAARGYSPDLIRRLVAAYRDESAAGAEFGRINFRCAEIGLPDAGRRFFVKEFPRGHRFHDLERWLRLSRVDRAWRAAHLLGRLGVPTPKAVGTAHALEADGTITEYLVTEWLAGAKPFPEVYRASAGEARLSLLEDLGRKMREWHDEGIYLRDLVKNVLVGPGEDGQCYWLTDLDGLHPFKRMTRARSAWHLRQLAHHVGPLGEPEVKAVERGYGGEWVGEVLGRARK